MRSGETKGKTVGTCNFMDVKREKCYLTGREQLGNAAERSKKKVTLIKRYLTGRQPSRSGLRTMGGKE